MVDVLGQEIKAGDIIALAPSDRYTGLQLRKVKQVNQSDSVQVCGLDGSYPRWTATYRCLVINDKTYLEFISKANEVEGQCGTCL